MFVKNFDPNDPRFAKWNLNLLGKLSQKQEDALWDVDESVDLPPLTKTESIDLCKNYKCQVDLTQGNLCYKIEKDWPKIYFNVDKYEELTEKNKRKVRYNMMLHAIYLYKKFIDMNQVKSYLDYHKRKTFAPYWEERFLRHRFERIRKIGEDEKTEETEKQKTSSVFSGGNGSGNFFNSLDGSLLTVINVRTGRERKITRKYNTYIMNKRTSNKRMENSDSAIQTKNNDKTTYALRRNTIQQTKNQKNSSKTNISTLNKKVTALPKRIKQRSVTISNINQRANKSPTKAKSPNNTRNRSREISSKTVTKTPINKNIATTIRSSLRQKLAKIFNKSSEMNISPCQSDVSSVQIGNETSEEFSENENVPIFYTPKMSPINLPKRELRTSLTRKLNIN